jgi:glycosyltransferase involved in cell wall biosynthesis
MAATASRLTIGLPVYNGERFIEKTVQSLLEQTFPHFEVIIGDNASTDRTGEIAREFAVQDRRVRYVRHERNLGLAGNYNALFRQASQEFFKWAPADDYYDPRYLEACIGALDDDPRAVLAYTRTQFVDEAGGALAIDDPGWDLRGDDAAERLMYTIRADHWVNSVIGVIRSDALARTRLQPAHGGGDYVLLGELSLQGRFIEVPERLFFRRIHPEASSQLRTDRERGTRLLLGRSDALSLHGWQRLAGHLRTIATGPLPVRARARLILGLGRASLNRSTQLRQELAAGFRWLVARRGRAA